MLRLVLVTIGTVAVLSLMRLDIEADTFEVCPDASEADARDRQFRWRALIAGRRITHRVGVVLVAAGGTAAVAAFADLGLRLALADRDDRGVSAIVRPEWSGVLWWAIAALIAVVAALIPLARIWIVGREVKSVVAVAVAVGLLSIPALWTWIKDKVARCRAMGHRDQPPRGCRCCIGGRGADACRILPPIRDIWMGKR